MTGFSITFDPYRPKLVVDQRRVERAMGEEAKDLLRESGRLPSDTGQFRDSIRVTFRAGVVQVGPTGERNVVIAAVFARRGNDLLEFDQAETARIVAAGQRELDRQVKTGEARVKG